MYPEEPIQWLLIWEEYQKIGLLSGEQKQSGQIALHLLFIKIFCLQLVTMDFFVALTTEMAE